MKIFRSKSAVCAIVVMLLLLFIQIPTFATNDENIIIKKADKEFILYFKDICNNEFQFAFSVTNQTKKEDLNFKASIKDQLNEDGLNVAYVDEELYNQFFKDSNSSYIWIMDNSGKTLVEAKMVSLEDALNDEIINEVNNITKKISIDTTKEETTEQEINGTYTTVTTGKIVLNPLKNASYFYKLVKVEDENSDYFKLFNLAEQIEAGVKGTYNSFELTKQFYEVYSKLVPKKDDQNWNKVENNEILQPENSENGDKYIVFLKEESGNKTTIDAKFLVSKKVETEDVKKDVETITETVKLPVTYDSIILFVILAIVIIAIIVVAILRARANKNLNK